MLIYLDIETTGLKAEDRICAFGALFEREDGYEMVHTLLNLQRKIPPQASSVHNITNEMVADKPTLQDSKEWQKVVASFQDAVFVMHNAPFETEMLLRSGYRFEGDYIDTMRVAKHLIEDIESYALNFLRYELRLYKKEPLLLSELGIDEPLCPHNAKSDVIITKLLLDALLELAPFERLLELSKKPVLLQKFPFGKYAGRYIEEIAMIDRSSLEWMVHTLEEIDEDLRYTLEYYL